MKKLKLTFFFSLGLAMLLSATIDSYSQSGKIASVNRYRVKRLVPFLNQVCTIKTYANEIITAKVAKITSKYVQLCANNGPFFQSSKNILLYDIQTICSGTKQEKFTSHTSSGLDEHPAISEKGNADSEFDNMLATLDDGDIFETDSNRVKLAEINEAPIEIEKAIGLKESVPSAKYNPIKLLQLRSKKKLALKLKHSKSKEIQVAEESKSKK